jgi:hypothetical protein
MYSGVISSTDNANEGRTTRLPPEDTFHCFIEASHLLIVLNFTRVEGKAQERVACCGFVVIGAVVRKVVEQLRKPVKLEWSSAGVYSIDVVQVSRETLSKSSYLITLARY